MVSFLQLIHRRATPCQRATPPIGVVTREPTLAARVAMSVRHERFSRPDRRIAAASGRLRHPRAAHNGRFIRVRSLHGRAASRDAGVETFADLVLLALMAFLPPEAEERDGEKAEGDDDYHDDPFL